MGLADIGMLQALQRVLNARRRRFVGEASPLVSIVTPSYNQGEFTGRTVNVGAKLSPIEYRQSMAARPSDARWLRSMAAGSIDFRTGPRPDACRQGASSADGEICAYLNSDDIA
jgi:hypothetical protein